MNVVVDASAIGTVLLPDEDRRVRAITEEVCAVARLHVPPVWRVEVTSLVLKAFRQRRITDQEQKEAGLRADLIADAAEIGPQIRVAELLSLAAMYSLRAHDATYLHLARSLQLPLLTNDTQMLRAAAALGVELLRP